MKAQELLKKDKKELEGMIQESKKRLSELKFKSSISKLKNSNEVRNIKKDIARILTVLKFKI